MMRNTVVANIRQLLIVLAVAMSILVSNVSSAFTPATAGAYRSTTTTRAVVATTTFTIQPLAAASSPAVLEPPVKEVEKVKDEEKEAVNYKKGGWAVRLFNDPMNKREFVAMCLSKIVGLTDGQAYQVMMQAHQNGVAIVGRFDLERAELYRNALLENGLVCDMIPVEED
jgi:ATP-dependent Clp protease adaptor protein ClpS